MSPKEPTHKSLGPVVAEFDHLFEVTNDPKLPDFACAILVTSFLNDALGALLDSRFGGNSTKNRVLAPENGLLGSLRAKADVAYCMNLISKGCAANIIVTGEIRNRFAHRFPEITFKTQDVIEKCEALCPPKAIVKWVPDTPEMREASERIYNIGDPKRRFILISQGLCATILGYAHLPFEPQGPIADQWE
jgi:hypothetical protein